MTLSEFRAFLEGMDIKDAPTPAQWARIAEKLAEVQEVAPVLPCPITVPAQPCPPAIPWYPLPTIPPTWNGFD